MDPFCCMICRSDSFKLVNKGVRDSNKHDVVQCNYCRHIQLYPLPSLENDKKFYDHDIQSKTVNQNLNFEEIKRKSQSDIVRRKKYVEKLIKRNDKILDIGSGYGFFIESMEKHYSIEGIEISEERRNIARLYCSSTIYDYNLLTNDSSTFIQKKYDLVTLFHVLEHIIQPKQFLINIKPLLRDSGKILIEVPNVNDHLLGINTGYRDFFWQRAHVSYFSHDILKELLLDIGYTDINVIGVQRYSIENMMNWVITGSPQIKNPSQDAQLGLQWLDDYYRKYLCDHLISDTLIVTARS